MKMYSEELLQACGEGDLELVKSLIKRGANINEGMKNRGTQLLVACEAGNLDIIKYLVENGADVNLSNTSWSTPLLVACQNRNKTKSVTIAKYLLEHGADPNMRVLGRSLLERAFEMTDFNLIKYLIQHGANVNELHQNRETYLTWAIKKKYLGIVKDLVKYGADVNKGNKKKVTPLHYACIIKNVNLVKYLINHGADVNSVDVYGDTALYCACILRQKDIAKCLIENGADISLEYFEFLKDTTPIFDIRIAIKNRNMDDLQESFGKYYKDIPHISKNIFRDASKFDELHRCIEALNDCKEVQELKKDIRELKQKLHELEKDILDKRDYTNVILLKKTLKKYICIFKEIQKFRQNVNELSNGLIVPRVIMAKRIEKGIVKS